MRDQEWEQGDRLGSYYCSLGKRGAGLDRGISQQMMMLTSAMRKARGGSGLLGKKKKKFKNLFCG